eukprot:TRINITY_DN32816_c0_g1_i1.p1 TRINITY_DN32816_c0_g1~~TRINITY_DN32816_c0_g1_i1.p1  ORF type:complete len:365 (+),score=131.01 TRINITY_DN32816_c0_g1_i1:56-1096(+)
MVGCDAVPSPAPLLGEPPVEPVKGKKYAQHHFRWQDIWIPIQADSLIDLSPCACQLNEYYFFGNIAFAKEEPRLRGLGITHVLSLTRQRLPDEVRRRYNCKQISVSDTPQTSIAHVFEDAFQHIEDARKAGGKVFVHCRAGVSRVSCVTIAYTMKTYRMTLKEAYLRVKRTRPVAHPNKGFLMQLAEYEKHLFGPQAQGVDMHALPYALWERAEHLELNNPIPPLDICHLTENVVREAFRQKYGYENVYRTLDAGLGGKMGLHCVHLYSVDDFHILDWAIRTVLSPSQNVGPTPECLHDWPPQWLRERQAAPSLGSASSLSSGTLSTGSVPAAMHPRAAPQMMDRK